ncbi:hypothetical protein Zmor_012581 [Zophobas morio]|uniref:C2H2-type domain-containing protein n=1 Tax=Zophobas morio TaxID=2755281 RepID=A0AA38IGB9_9CUCU|nr:hypothetical protein Zmor_012581 [Zophobas morio]
MPKDKQVRTQSRRAASKEALKQMHLLLGDEKHYEISSDDDDVIEVEVQPPKKKYKLSHRKSSDGNDRDVIVLKTVDEAPFELEVVVEELAPCQLSRNEQLQKETKEVDAKIEQLLSTPNTEVVYNGLFTTAVEVTEQIQNIITNATAAPAPQYTLPGQTNALPPPASNVPQQPVPGQSIVLQQQSPGNANIPQSYQLVMDPRLGVIVGTVSTANASANTPPLQLYQPKVTMAATASPATSNEQPPTMKTRRGTILRQVPNAPLPPLHKTTLVQQKAPPPPVNKPNKGLQVKQNLLQKNVQQKAAPKPAPTPPKPAVATPKAILPMKGRPPNPPPVPTAPFRPTESNVEGGLSMGKPSKSIDLTGDDGRALPDSREVSFNKLQGRTYPSLVVVARPHLRVKDLAADRGKLDVKVKSVLMYPPTKFTEWLIQQGLVRSDQKCSIHTANPLKLGMYSDASKFPYSGGYVWISECCPQRFVSVFSGSLFEGSQHPPMAILKLLYHWCCQTIVQNVTQWVKVDNLYVKGMYTWLRSVCTVALHTHIKQLGGPGVKVQVGVISLGTTSQDGNKREVKVEVLGILETTTRHIRLRAVEPLADGERNYKKRFTKILEPVFNWVHPSSIIVTDLTVDKTTLHQMGFLHVSQSTSTDYANSNRTIMEYLRRIVPRMFQNTLSLLSRQIIQQFLDELVWREWYGTTVLQCFDNMVQHLSEQTRHDSGQSLVVRLNKVSANPFKNWSIPIIGASTAPATPKTAEPPAPKRYSRQRKPTTPQPQPPQVVQDVVRPVKSTSPDVPEQLVPLENYYYGTITPPQENRTKVTISIKCPFCKLTFNTNITLMNHLFKHAHNVSNDVQLCKYCLTIVPTANDLLKHISSSHPDETKFDNGFVCLICECHFRNPFILGKHMSKEHCPSELPYLCGTCNFRCSNHKLAVDHFYQQHDYGTTIQCPFCLKSTTIYSGGRNISQNMNYFIQHLQKHQKKQLAKRCGKCTLWFIQKEFLKDHQTKMHVSQRGKNGLVPCFAPRNGVMVPKSKMDKCPDDAIVINFSTLFFNVGKNLNCKECDKPLSTPKHFASFESCQNTNCQYSTCCSNAMQEHAVKCKSVHADIPAEKLPFEMFCICGYRDIYGNQMAKHLAICERKSAYPSRQAAKGATVTQCMLDVLGLVRKPEEAKEVTKEPKEAKEEQPKQTTEPKEVKDIKRPEGGNSVQPIILKHRGRPRKYPGIAKPPDKEPEKAVIEVKEDAVKNEGSVVQINISDVRGGVEAESTEVKDGEGARDKVTEEVDLTENDSNEEAKKSEQEESTTEKKEENEDTDKSTKEDADKVEDEARNEKSDAIKDQNEEPTTVEEQEKVEEQDKGKEAEQIDDEGNEASEETEKEVVDEEQNNEATSKVQDEVSNEEQEETGTNDNEEPENEVPTKEQKNDVPDEEEVKENQENEAPSEEQENEVTNEEEPENEERNTTPDNEVTENEDTTEGQDSEDTRDDAVGSEEKDVTEDEEPQANEVVSSSENTNDTNEHSTERGEDSERMEVDSSSTTETIDKVAIENNEESEKNVNICPMDTD